MRVALGVEYDGSEFFGWQSQPNLRTVQGCLQEALSKVANQEIQVTCAGRTDTGVHATSQVVHFDCDVERSSRAWVYGTNSFLAQDVTVKWAKSAEEDFHARFSATARRYRYIIYNHPIRPSVIRTSITWHYRPLDHEKMAEAGQFLIGEHDFSSFRAIDCQSKSPYRNVKSLDVLRRNDLVIIDIEANAFLHHMVRNIVGSLMLVGSGKNNPSWIKDVLQSKKRANAGETAPSYGLYLVSVTYPEQFLIPDSPNGPYFLLE